MTQSDLKLYFDKHKKVEIPKSLFGTVITVTGIAGSGKSYGAGKLIEIAEKHNIPSIVFDPQEAHVGLSKLGFKKLRSSEISPTKAYKLISQKWNSYVIIPYKDDLEEFDLWIAEFLEEYMKKRTKGLVLFCFDEAKTYLGKKNTPAKLQIRRLATQKRSTGRGIILITQKFSKLDEDTRDQSETQIFYKADGGDLAIIDQLLKSKIPNAKKRKLTVYEISQLNRGQCVIFSHVLPYQQKDITNIPMIDKALGKTEDKIPETTTESKTVKETPQENKAAIEQLNKESEKRNTIKEIVLDKKS